MCLYRKASLDTWQSRAFRRGYGLTAAGLVEEVVRSRLSTRHRLAAHDDTRPVAGDRSG